MEFINKFLNSATLPLLKILPLPFPLTSRAAQAQTQASVRSPNSFVRSLQYCVLSSDHIAFRFSIKLHRSA